MSEFTFRAAHADPRTTRWLHIGFYLGALLLSVAAVHSLYLYFTAWSAPDDNSHLWQLVLGLLYLLGSLGIVYATYHHGDHHGGESPPDRYARVDDGTLVYELDQLSGQQRVKIADITAAERTSVRDLVLTLRDGSQHVVPIYLIDDEAKQAELEGLLR